MTAAAAWLLRIFPSQADVTLMSWACGQGSCLGPCCRLPAVQGPVLAAGLRFRL